MASHRPMLIELPVGPSPGWELDGSEAPQDLRSVAESSIIAYSLRQSRERWLFHTFPKFSSKTRGSKASDVAPPPHTIQTLGKCDLEIGPHMFPDTTLYEVNYFSPQTAHTTSPQSTWSSQTAQSVAQKPGNLSSSATPAPSTEGNTAGGPDSAASFTAVTPITPALINQVNSAASSNPILANLLQLAAAGKATPDQLKTLGILIQSLATMETSPPVRELDLVLEFREVPSDRWLFPRTPVICQRIPSGDMLYVDSDILLTVRIPFDQQREQDVVSDNITSVGNFEKVIMRLHKPPIMVEETINKWLGDEAKRKIYDGVIQKLNTEPAAQVFLSHHVSAGTLATQLQNAMSAPYALKPIKQGPTTLRSSRGQRRKQAEQNTTEQTTGKAEDSPPTKRRQTARQRASVHTQIRCMTCGQTDVPLILGGRFCRPCVDSGKFAQNAPQPHLMSTSSTSNIPQPPPCPVNNNPVSQHPPGLNT
ncbi:hypothetical protein BDQ17DRAFT_1536249 [Cyathus striatus]|nr:hypothetical protein BDQ17DRAFT_1536249 [Cyathus striatus]